MTDLYAPNQQLVRADGSGPAEEGDGGSTAPPDPGPGEPGGNGEDAPKTLDDMTKDELVAYATEHGVEVNAGATKAEIRSAIDAAAGG